MLGYVSPIYLWPSLTPYDHLGNEKTYVTKFNTYSQKLINIEIENL